jgi:hypothetical protein
VQVQDKDSDDDLDRVEYGVTDGNGTTRGTPTDSASGGQYKEKNVTIDPDDPAYAIVPGETYTLTVRASDADGNTDTETGVGGGPCSG